MSFNERRIIFIDNDHDFFVIIIFQAIHQKKQVHHPFLPNYRFENQQGQIQSNHVESDHIYLNVQTQNRILPILLRFVFLS